MGKKFKSQSLKMIKLTNNAISTMFSQGNGRGDKFVVEVQNVKQPKEDFLKMDLRDGTTSVKAIVYIIKPQLNILKVCKPIDREGRYLIKITEFITHASSSKLMLEIMDFVPLTQINPPSTKIQESPKLTFRKEVKLQEKQEIKPAVKQEMKTERKEAPKNRKPPIESAPPEDRRVERDEEQYDNVTEDQLKDFQKISDLFIDFQGRWELVVRVLDKSYREFTSRNQKLTKIFNMTLIDRTGMKIQGVMFGDNAHEYHDLIHQGRVYRMSKGQVREQSYNQSKGKDYSRFNIVFSKNSVFIPISEVKCIPRKNEKEETMEEIISGSNLEKIYSFTAILLEIGQEKNLSKDDRIIYKKNLVIGDPLTKKSIEVVIWNKDLYIDSMWQGRAVQLKNFKLHSYKDVLSFSTIFRSEIVLREDHPFCKFQGKYQLSDYEPYSGPREDKYQERERTCRFIKEIQSELAYTNSSEPVFSDVEVWLTHMVFKNKWNYEACNNPKCKRQAESDQRCIHCGHNNATVQKRFILPIELSDCTGSIWATAFDEFSSEIFKGLTIEQLLRMDETRLKEEAECRLYHQFKLRISSKKEAEGNVKHNIVGKASEVNIERASISNIQKIKRALF